MDLTTNYLGLTLRSPLVPSASPLSEKIDNVRAMEQAGPAAVVFHSLFEEQIEASAPEFRIDPNTYLENITQAKRAVGIPIIGSLNCTTLGGWISYARRITEAGADALELNIYRIPTRPEVTGSTIENIYIETVRSIRAATKIPLAIKLSPYFSSFANMAISLDDLNVDGLVLFNRFYQPDIDLQKMEVTAWLQQHQRKSLAEIKGIMSQQNCPDPSAFERAQYVRGLSSYTSLFPMRR